ncbi:MAG TPA: hypothetical protein VNS81_01270 [Nocardioides sp.]|nr:hypothetical protein [Nocardioides sp.]
MQKLLTMLAAVAFSLIGLSAPADAAATDTTTIWVGLGSGHLYHGTYDACTGVLNATGTTTGATGVYAETLTGTYNKATGQLTFTSVYGMDTNGVVDDSTGVNNSAYAYTLSGAVVNNWVTGSFSVTKTPLGGTPVTSDQSSVGGQSVWFEVSDNGGVCTPPPALDGGNHGQCVSTKAKTLSGKALASWAKDVNWIGYDCHYAA